MGGPMGPPGGPMAAGLPERPRAPVPQQRNAAPPPGAPPGILPGGRAPVPGPSPRPASATAPGATPVVEIGQLVENIPKSMRVAVPQRVEVRIGKASIRALAEGLQGGGAAWRHDVTITKAMSVRLRAPEGGFYIESASPETQWIENTLGLMADDYASWRWTITPQARGWRRLQLVVSARTIGADGLAAETALPDQLIDVRVRTNYGKVVSTAAGWLAAALAGGIIAKLGEDAFAAALSAALKAVTG